MSVLSEVYAVPSRLLGVFRYLLHARGQSESTDTLARILAPESLPRRADGASTGEEEGSGREMVRKTVNEAVAMGLLAEAEGEIRLHPGLPEDARDPEVAEGVFPVTLANLLFAKERSENHDFALALAWYLTQDACDAPGTWPDVDRALREQVGGDQLGMKTSNPYHMLEDWACYLGFAWTHALGDKTVLTPDPTAHLMLRLGELLPGKPRVRHPFPEACSRLAQLCPVFEGGVFRAEVERQWRPREQNQLSSVTALAWLRLRDEGYVELVHESDANTLILPDGDLSQTVSHVSMLVGTQKEAA
jgi:hypothetical protein